MTFDEKLGLALAATYETREKQILDVPQKHKFSLGYRLWEYRTLKNLSRERFDKHWTLRRARYAVGAAVTAVSFMLAVSVYSVGSTIGRYWLEDNTEYSKLVIDSASSDKTTIEECYGLPEEEGWKLTHYFAFHDNTGIIVNYERDGKKVSFSQNVISGYTSNVNTENAVVEPMSLYKNDDGFFIKFQKSNEVGLFWIYDGYFMTLIGNITKEEAVSLAYSTKITNY